MHIAYVVPSLRGPGGWRSHALAFIHALRTHVEPYLLVSQGELDEARRLFPDLEMAALPTTQQFSLRHPHGWLPLLAARRQIAALQLPQSVMLRRPAMLRRIDLVHSLEAYPTGLVGSWLARRLGCPHVLTAHGTYGVIWRQYALDAWAYRRVLRRAARVFPVSHGTARIMQRHFAAELPPEKVHPILNGSDYAARVPVEVAEARLIPERTHALLLSVGDLKPRKGQHLSLAAFQQVQAALPEAQYWIVGKAGSGSYPQHLQQIVERLALKNVRFLGAVSNEELDRCYRQASIFVLTPEQRGDHFEGFGLVYLEAGAYGLPVVATRSGGVPDAVRDGETGLLADEGDVSGVAQAILRLAQDRDLQRKMGLANRRWAETLTWERAAQEQLDCYREVLQGA